MPRDREPLTLRQTSDREDLTVRRQVGSFRSNTIDEATRSVEFVVLTQDPVMDIPPDLGEIVDEIVLVDGVERAEQIPLVEDHNKYSVQALHGSLRNFRVEGDQLIARAFFASDPESDALWTKVKEGHLTDLSGGFRALEAVDIAPGTTATVRGKTYTAGQRPTRVTVRSMLREGSLVTVGADPRARARAASDAANPTTNRAKSPSEDPTMKFSDWLKTLGLDEASLNDTERTDLQGEFAALNETQRADVEVGKACKGRHEARRTLATAGNVNRQGQPQADETQRTALSQADVQRAAREAVETERARVQAIEDLAGGDEALADTVRSSIAAGHTVDEASKEILKKIRANRAAPVHAPNYIPEPTVNREALALALTMRSGIDPMRGVREGQRAERERLADVAHRLRDLSMFDVCRMALQLDGRRVPFGREDTIREAVSGGTLGSIFTTSVNANLLEAFVEAGDTTIGLTRDVDVPDFKTNDRIRASEAAGLKRLSRGAEAEHDTISDGKESYKIARYARQFVIDEQDIIDDNFDVLVSRPRELGNAARRLRPDLVYAILLRNAALADTVALFHTTHKNTQTGGGSALSSTSLQTALQQLGKQTGVSAAAILNLMGKFLIIPTALRYTAATLLKSGEIREGRGGTATSAQGTYNALREENLEARSEARIDNGFTDPSDDTAVAGSATKWFVIGDPARCPTIEVGYLRGSNRQPSLRSYVLDRGQWGIGFDVKHDIGAKAIDYRNMQYSAGA